MITYTYKVSMTPGGIPVRCKLGQYDDDWTIVFTLYSACGTFSIESGTTAKIRGTKRDGLGYSANATINISAGTVTVAGDKQITAVAGDNLFELVLLKGTKELSTANIIFSVEPAAMDAGTLVSDSQVQEILDMSADVIAASANVSTLRGNFAPAYSSSSTYSVGDYAMYNNQLYRCTTAISTAEAWTAGHWTAVALGDDVSDLKSDVGNIANGLLIFDEINGELVAFATGEITSNSAWSRTDYTEIPTNGLFAYMPNGYNGYNWFYDENKNPISQFYINKQEIRQITVPTNATYFVISNTSEGLDSLQVLNNQALINLENETRIASIENNEIWNEFPIYKNTALHNIEGFFMRGTYNSGISRTGNNLVTDILCSPFDTTFFVKQNAPINIVICLFNRNGGGYETNHTVTSGHSFSVGKDTPFLIILRNNDGSKAVFSAINDYLMCNFVPYDTKAKMYFIGQTPDSYPHENVTTSGCFNLIETSTGKIIVNDASHASNNAFIADFINQGRKHFDYFILSHWHNDHCGLLGEFIRLGRIDSDTTVFLPQDLESNFISVFPQEQNTLDLFENYIVRLRNSGATIIYPVENSRYYIDGLILEFWNTEHGKYYELEATAKNYNDLSLCFYLIDNNVRVCFPGDLGPIGQDQCKDNMLRCNIHNAQHHGWDNGVNNLIAGYIDKLSPEIVIANDGRAHSTYYEQDGSPMVTWCINNCVPFYRCFTQQNGYTSVKITPDSWNLIDPAQRYRRSSSETLSH